MPKKAIKKIIKNEDTDDEYDIDEDDVEDFENDIELEDDIDDDIKEEYMEQDTDTNVGIIDELFHDDELFENEDNINESKNTIKDYVAKEDRISVNRLTKYEMVRILGERTKQLTMGAKVLIKNGNTLSYDKIAEEELKLNMIPFKIIRVLPNGNHELWTLDELKKDHLYSQLE